MVYNTLFSDASFETTGKIKKRLNTHITYYLQYRTSLRRSIQYFNPFSRNNHKKSSGSRTFQVFSRWTEKTVRLHIANDYWIDEIELSNTVQISTRNFHKGRSTCMTLELQWFYEGGFWYATATAIHDNVFDHADAVVYI